VLGQIVNNFPSPAFEPTPKCCIFVELMKKQKNKPMIVFGDIHGLSYWKKIVEENPEFF